MRVLLLFLFPFCLFAQKDKDYSDLKKNIEKICKKNITSFHKAHIFYFNQQIDSSFIYSSQAYNQLSDTTEIRNYLDYIYGVSALEKKFNSIALEKLESIPNSFPYKYLVDYNLASISLENREYNKALNYYNSVIKSNRIQSTNKLKRAYHNIGLCYLHLKKYPESEKFLLKELKISQNEKDTLSIIYAKLDLGNLFYEQYKDTEAIQYFEEAYHVAQLFSNITAKQNTAQNMAVVEKNRKRYKESVDYYTEYIKWKDSLWNRDKISALLEKDKQIAVAVKEKEVFAQKQITKKQKERIQLFVIAFIIISVFLGALLYLYRIKIKQNKFINLQRQQLEESNNTKNYLISVISHDLRTPINLLKNNHKKLSDLLEINNINSAKNLNNENTSIAKSTSQLLDNILNWALQQSDQLLFNPETHPIEVLVDAILFDFRPLASAKNIELNTKYLSSNAQVFLDKELFKIAFRNLIDNAIKYTPNGGKITIETSIQNKECILKIRDSGTGMPSKVLDIINNYKVLTIEKIDRSKGLGLGLLLSKTLITKNKGTFTLSNNDNLGMTVAIGLLIKET
ncbi:ATP-binding protein [uncultured Aquimarina sp.]|uniref:tetratricopeptide repeat-containing sensor histidine kinase n=1 Tax=uncultured Aquimarina sp. TaxID=575652 RepID=UPI0026111C60|nr:ATP-binding protein [uncultured Aquimarina sp.]